MSADPGWAARWARTLTEPEQGAVAAVDAAATDTDGVAPLSEQSLLRLGQPRPAVDHLLVRTAAGDVAGYAQLDTGADVAQAELVVAPAHRQHGVGGQLLAAVLGKADGRLQVWAHGELPAAAALAARMGLRRARVLWQVGRALTPDLPAPRWPPAIVIRTFVPGQDDVRWVECNAAAFAHHPEQGGWTLDDLAAREAEPWFDPAGFFLAEPAPPVTNPGSPPAAEPGLAGFHWTKVHPAEHGRAAIGEVYVIGVAPGAQGTGLGRALLLHGLRHLAGQGLADVMLYVDDDNEPAMTLYERMGFTRRHGDVQYETPGISG